MRVLIVDDDGRCTEVLRNRLAAEQVVVDVVHDAVEGFRLAAAGRYDVLIIDVVLPGTREHELANDLRRHGIHTPVMIVSGVGDERVQAEALDLGADDYLTKPFSFLVLVARLRALARRHQVNPMPDIVVAAGLTLNVPQRQVFRGRTAIALTRRESGLLELLMRHVDEIVTKDQIRVAVWNALSTNENVVEVYISYLRRKIDVPFHRRTIETVRGVGYRLRSRP
ncbi:response regulator transcription factor [Nocardia sp. BMG111209]|uniref:response regulator transcription factor n=1 Tax=Nocardia sp. BMG111209 TaxID=1160137 RepID=UPI00037F8EB5|nr:response regulator transcription factor [Nocardia sp. BMG111209]